MVSSQLQTALERGADAVERMGLTRGILDLAGYRAVLGPTPYPWPRETRVRDLQIGDVPCKEITAPGADPAVRILYLHGGGYVAGGVQSHGGIAAWISTAARAVVVFPEYRLAPESPFPAGLDDALTAWDGMTSSADAGEHVDQGSFVVGDSAGAGMAVALALRLKNRASPQPTGIVLLSPFLNLDPRTSKRLAQSGFERGLSEAYVGSFDPAHPLISTVFADLKGLAPTLIQVGDADPLMQDAIDFARLAGSHHVDVKLDVYAGLPHVWHKHVPEVPEAVEAIDAVGIYIRSRVPSTIQP